MLQYPKLGLNAPCGAGCFLTCETRMGHQYPRWRLNAPFGAGCFLTAAS